MIQAYIDEGGTHDQATIIVMAGFVSSYKRWRKFEKQWNAVLNPDGGSRVFHATDCLGKDGHGDFEGWPKEKRDALVEALIPIARRQTLASFACAFSLQDYREVVPKWIQEQMVHPYYLAMFSIVNILYVHRARLSLRNEKIGFVFERKPKFVGLLTSLYDDIKYSGELYKHILGKITPDGTSEEDIPLQAADLLCYVVRTFFEKDYAKRDSAHRRTIDLAQRLAFENYLMPDFLDRDALQKIVHAYEETHQIAGDWNWKARKPSINPRAPSHKE
jgi:hypothetical protein